MVRITTEGCSYYVSKERRGGERRGWEGDGEGDREGVSVNGKDNKQQSMCLA